MFGDPSGISGLQERDVATLKSLFESRIMKAVHISAIHYGGKNEYAKKRLQKLKAVGLISERKRKINEPAILHLSRKGFEFLAHRGELAGFPRLGVETFAARTDVSKFTVDHELEVMDVKAAFHGVLQESARFSISKFFTWPTLYQFRASRASHEGMDVLVKPDGFFRIREQLEHSYIRNHHFFLEVDRSTESQDILAARSSCYLDFYRSGGFAERNGATSADFKRFPFRLLIVLKSPARRDNTAKRLVSMNPPVLSLAWLTTREEVLRDPLGSIWVQPKDYRWYRGGLLENERSPSSSPIESASASDPGSEIESRIPTYRLFAE